MERLQWLLEFCGGLCFGSDLEAQLAITAQAKGFRLAGEEYLERLRFSCRTRVSQLIREEPGRIRAACTLYSKPIPGHFVWPAGPLDQLEPNPISDSHPYPVELQLPRWTVADDWDLRNWLFRWGAGIRIEARLRCVICISLWPVMWRGCTNDATQPQPLNTRRDSNSFQLRKEP